jgi:hypothetical protein
MSKSTMKVDAQGQIRESTFEGARKALSIPLQVQASKPSDCHSERSEESAFLVFRLWWRAPASQAALQKSLE